MDFDKNPLPKPVYLDRVQITEGFWESRQDANRNRTIPAIYHQLEATGRIAAWSLNPNRQPPKRRHVVQMFWDSDSAKWLEAVGYSLHTHPDPQLETQADDLINRIEKAQQPNGYLNTYFPVLAPHNQWRNLRDWHEMYNAGHLIEAAVAYFKATGKRTLLDILSRKTDLIDSMFGPDDGKKRGYPGHPELELALVKLYRETGEQRFLELSTYFINERGQSPHYFDQESHERGENPADFWAQTYRYCQAHVPLREQAEATGHSVRACYLYAGIADVALETGDQELVELSRTLWDDLTQHQMYITGGLGPAHSNEGFTFAYDLPNETAYAETCASIALVFWAHRMFHIDPDSRYIDEMERALYNNILSGVSFTGDEFFYANPLTSYPHVNPYDPWSGITNGQHYRRETWFECPCCPPNLARMVASIGSYCYSKTADRLYVHLYNSNNSTFNFDNQDVRIEQRTQYPWDGRVGVTVKTDVPVEFELALRVPNWCRNFTVTVNDDTYSPENKQGYVVIKRAWVDGDCVVLVLEMPVERIMPHPHIRQNAGQIALQRGPLIYCLEEVDNGAQLANIIIPPDAQLSVTFDPQLFDGVCTITGEALRVEPSQSWTGGLYQPQSMLAYQQTPIQFKAVPYNLWANREPGEMRVWIRHS